MRVPAAAASDFVFVNLFRAPIGAPMRPDAVGELLAAASRRAGLDTAIRPHQLRHACGSNLADAGGGIDVVADLLGHASVSSSQVYVHPDASRLRAAVDAGAVACTESACAWRRSSTTIRSICTRVCAPDRVRCCRP